MIDLGWTLAWLSVQVACLLGPALLFQARAARSGPGAGAWVAGWSLALVVVLDVAAFCPPLGWVAPPVRAAVASSQSLHPAAQFRAKPEDLTRHPDPTQPAGWGGLRLNMRAFWSRLGGRASRSATQLRPWGWMIAVGVLGVIAHGSMRLGLGFWAISRWRRRGLPVTDPALLGLVEDLRQAMGCRSRVEVRLVADLATPATAGWWRPLILLPPAWREWSASEQRVVLAHELAHLHRGDYTAGVLARVAVIMNAPNPLVRGMAQRLLLEQELAADALGARFAGGTAAYLVALSGLALKQDGRMASGPAREFLPARGTLIRRIAMLQSETQANGLLPVWSTPRRLATGAGLLALTLGLATLKRPAQADDAPPSHPQVEAAVPPSQGSLGDAIYMSPADDGVLALRPAALAQLVGRDQLAPVVHALFGADVAEMAGMMGVDLNQPHFRKIEAEEIESILLGVRFSGGSVKGSAEKLHRVEEHALAVRMVAPFDWLSLLRQWQVGIEELRTNGQVYYKLTLGEQAIFPHVFAFLPDDRTIFVDDQP